MARRSMREWMELLLTRGPEIRASELAARAKVSRQAAQRHIARAVAEGRLEPVGAVGTARR